MAGHVTRQALLRFGAGAAILGVGSAAATALAPRARCDEDRADKPEFWTSRWTKMTKANITPGFHSSEVHPRLKEFSSRLVGDLPAGGRRILVPLCGKTLDLLYLSKIGETSGVECAQEAIDGFGADNRLTPNLGSKTTKDTRLFDFGAPGPDANPIKIGKFNFFELPKAWDGKDAKFTMAWDRAAFVAIHPDSRDKYAKALADQMAPGGKVLMCTMSYDTSKMDGPPFSLSPEQVEKHCGPYFGIEELDTRSIIHSNPNFKQRGLDEIHEHTFLLTRKAA